MQRVHAATEIEPLLGRKEPGGQSWQVALEVCPVLPLYEPAAHWEH